VAGMPIKFFEESVKSGATLADLADNFLASSREHIVSEGGFYSVLHAGDGIMIPPGYMLTQASLGCISNASDIFDEVTLSCTLTVHAMSKQLFKSNKDSFNASVSLGLEACPTTPAFQKHLEHLKVAQLAFNAFAGCTKSEALTPPGSPLPIVDAVPVGAIDWTRSGYI
jgi:hypothetical protein